MKKYYSHNDHHYNLFGAYETYLAVMERLTPVLGDLPIFTEDQFTWKSFRNMIITAPETENFICFHLSGTRCIL